MEYEEESSSILDSVYSIFGNYGWHILIVSIIAIIIYNKAFKSWIEEYKARKFEQEYSAKYHKNPDVFAAHVNGQQQWAEKMQEKYNREAEKHQRKLKEKEERKKQEFVDKYGGEGGHVLGGGNTRNDDNKKPNTLRTDYNPLTGSGSPSNYRPPRRSPCGGGGCGR